MISTNSQAMLFSPQSLGTIDVLRERLGLVLKERALDAAKRDGRKLVLDGDVWRAAGNITICDLVGDLYHEAVKP